MERPRKEQIRELPLFVGVSLENIKVVKSKKEAKEAVKELRNYTCLGFDTESKPCFQKGETNTGPHLIQISSKSKTFLFPTRFLSAIEALNEILSNPNIKKVGFGLSGDKRILHKKFGINLVNSQDLAVKVKNFAGTEQRVGLRVAVAMFFQQRLSKSAQKSNWSAFPLRERQIRYAANDAYAALCIELELENAIKLRERDNDL